MVLATQTVANVNATAPSSLTRTAAGGVRGASAGEGGLSSMIEAVSGIGAVQARTPSEQGDHRGEYTGTRRDERGPDWARGRGATHGPGGPGRPSDSLAVTPFVVDTAIQAVESMVAGAPRLVSGHMAVRAVETYDSALEAVAGLLPRDQMGRNLDRAL